MAMHGTFLLRITLERFDSIDEVTFQGQKGVKGQKGVSKQRGQNGCVENHEC